MKRSNKKKPLSALPKQMKAKAKKPKPERKKYDGNDETMISTGSTLLDLAISGGRKRGGGIPGGIFVEIFGPSSSGKTVLLCEIAGAVQRQGGEVMFKDPEARLNKQFAQIFDLDVDKIDLSQPNTIPEVFKPIREWEPKNQEVINGVFADSLAALSTDMEMEDKDKYGMRRAKEFSEELRKTCRVLTERNMLLVASNQIRTNVDASAFGRQTSAPGGKALEFYASLRLRLVYSKKIKKKKSIQGKAVEKVVGIETEIEVDKSSVWEPYHSAPLTILFDYGIDDVRDCLQFIKNYSKESVYTLGGEKLDKSMDKSIALVEEGGTEMIQELKNEVIDLWEEIQEKFKIERKPKIR